MAGALEAQQWPRNSAKPPSAPPVPPGVGMADESSCTKADAAMTEKKSTSWWPNASMMKYGTR